MTGFKEKAKLFNAFFAKRCSLIKNSNKLISHLHYLLKYIYIFKIIQNLDPNKVHGHDNISIRMLKICGSSIYKPVEMIFKQCIETGVFRSERKSGSIVPISQKGDKQILKNY